MARYPFQSCYIGNKIKRQKKSLQKCSHLRFMIIVFDFRRIWPWSCRNARPKLHRFLKKNKKKKHQDTSLIWHRESNQTLALLILVMSPSTSTLSQRLIGGSVHQNKQGISHSKKEESADMFLEIIYIKPNLKLSFADVIAFKH